LLIKGFVPEHSVPLSSSRMNFHLKHPHNPDSQGFEPLVKADDACYVGAWGGRGSGHGLMASRSSASSSDAGAIGSPSGMCHRLGAFQDATDLGIEVAAKAGELNAARLNNRDKRTCRRD
jgi:hypothetical protein